jgi:Tol biopolymer transport system component
LGQGIPNDQYEIWLYHTTSMTVSRVTTASTNLRDSHFPSLSGNGAKIAFISDSDFLGQGIPQGQLEIWLSDLATLTLTRVTTSSASDRLSFHPSLNADGTKLAFMSNSDLLAQGITRNQSEIWLYDTATMTVTRLTSGTTASEAPSISADGNKIAFHSYSDFLGQGIPEWQAEIWLHQVSGKQFYLPIIFKK